MRSDRRRPAALVVLASVLLLGWSPAIAAPRAEAPNDPGFAMQWGLEAIGAPDAWASATGRGITIAVVDSGVALSHEDLQGGKVVGAVSCLDTHGDEMACADGGQDDDGHGSHVAGIAAATTGNGKGVAGVAPDASLLIVKVLRHGCDALGECTASGNGDDVSAGIRYAADHGADVINLSLGNTTQAVLGASFADALEYAWSKGAIPVVAAGNGFVLPSGFSNQHAVIVGALRRDGDRASYSNGVGQAMWALSAPGGESDSQDSCNDEPQGVLSTFWTEAAPDSAYACLAGTSMAAPHVAGALAVLRSSGLTAQQAVDQILATAHDLGSPGVDTTFGAGALDLAAAVTAAPAPSTTGTSPTPTTSPVGGDSTTTPSSTSDSTTSVVPPSSAPPTSGPPSASPSSTAPVVTLPSRPSTTSPEVAIRARELDAGDDLPAGPVTVAALMAAGVGCASGWFLIRGASWARRTPF
jgi:subtilisin family serine protease